MGQSLAEKYVNRMQTTAPKAGVWKWPQKLSSHAPLPDPRLLNGDVTELRAIIDREDGFRITTAVRAVSRHDLILVLDSRSDLPVKGQVVDVTVTARGKKSVINKPGIVHWSGEVSGRSIVGVFMVEDMGEGMDRWTCSGDRGEVRFPINVSAAIEVDGEENVIGSIIDYSLGGCRFFCEREIEIGEEYSAMALLNHSTVDLTLTPRWVLRVTGGYQMGCTFEQEQGVLMACRHHAQPSGLSTPLKPQTTDWSGTE